MSEKTNIVTLEKTNNLFDLNNIDKNHCIQQTAEFSSTNSLFQQFNKTIHFFYNPDTALIHITQNLDNEALEQISLREEKINVIFNTSISLLNDYMNGKQRFTDILNNNQSVIYQSEKNGKTTYTEYPTTHLTHSFLGKISNINENVSMQQLQCLPSFISLIEQHLINVELNNNNPILKKMKKL